MKWLLVITACVFVIGTALTAQDVVVQTPPQPMTYRIAILTFVFDSPCRVQIQLKSTPGDQELSHFYAGEDTCKWIDTLTSSNLSTTSMQRLILNKLIADKVITGTVTGKPAK